MHNAQVLNSSCLHAVFFYKDLMTDYLFIYSSCPLFIITLLDAWWYVISKENKEFAWIEQFLKFFKRWKPWFSMWFNVQCISIQIISYRPGYVPSNSNQLNCLVPWMISSMIIGLILGKCLTNLHATTKTSYPKVNNTPHHYLISQVFK